MVLDLEAGSLAFQPYPGSKKIRSQARWHARHLSELDFIKLSDMKDSIVAIVAPLNGLSHMYSEVLRKDNFLQANHWLKSRSKIATFISDTLSTS